jgi:hypothetical protein
MLLRLGFLDAYDVGVLVPQPFEEALAGRRPDAIGVQTNYSKQSAPP